MKAIFLFCLAIASFIPDGIFVLAGSCAKAPIVSLAFDDGQPDQFFNALPIIDSLGYKATFYIITKPLSENNPSRMNGNQVLQLYHDGQEIASHGRNHLNLAFCLPSTAKYEIEQSKKDLSAIGINATSFAYPEGNSNFLVRYFVRQAGYVNGRGTTRDAFNGLNTDRYNLCCKYVLNTTNLNDIKSWVNEAAENGYWLILLFHAVNKTDNTYRFSCTSNTFRGICLYLKSKDANILPVSQAFREYFPTPSTKD